MPPHENMQLGPVVGAYHMIWENCLLLEATRKQLVQSAHQTLRRVSRIINRMGNEFAPAWWWQATRFLYRCLADFCIVCMYWQDRIL